ncbi:hypothetical protein E3U23_01575 [Erythrobacter litoralis]|uniref:hypothetical protein n=1 Tax=Erythrobacter litoralis TaxID=39960 RepID=UPI0024361170|nr:hypothetical protein [Erythrobacter litoralis]MDG6077888.1 hypothetical protein [Erythrobacter litoralis]
MAGLLVLPVITVWLLFRRRYSVKHRLGGLALAIVGLAITIFAFALVQIANMTSEERQKLDERASGQEAGRRERRGQEETQKPSEAVEKAMCGGDIECAAKRTRSRAEPRCTRLIEDIARYRYEWTEGLSFKFFRAEWSHYDVYTKEYGPKRIIWFAATLSGLRTASGHSGKSSTSAISTRLRRRCSPFG